MSDVKLKSIRIAGIRGFHAEQKLEFGETLTVLAGMNNAGKSTVLRAIQLAVSDIVSGAAPERVREMRRDATTPFRFAFVFECEAHTFRELFAQGADFRVVINGPAIRPVHEYQGYENWNLDTKALVEFEVEVNDAGLNVILLARPEDSGRALMIGSSQPRAAPRLMYAQASREWVPAQDQGNIESIRRPVLTLLAAKRFAAWGYGELPSRDEWHQPKRRLQTDTDGEVQSAITFLRMKHPKSFESLQLSVLDAFHEFTEMNFIDNDGTNFTPALVPRADATGERLLGRRQFGAGSWAFLSMLTAAHLAHATGAEYLMLDEPHLYMHPGLERRLLRELLSPEKWPEERPLRIIAATHSPVFVNAALERDGLRILDWTADATALRVHNIHHSEDVDGILGAIRSAPSELFYADQVVFVEGESDASAIRILARKWGVEEALDGIRIEPLRQTDLHTKGDLPHVVELVARCRVARLLPRALLVLDEDKRIDCDPRWKQKLANTEDPNLLMEVEYVGQKNNDLESAFCDAQFLQAYFTSRIPEKDLPADLSQTINEELEKLDISSERVHPSKKGCAVLHRLHDRLLGQKNDAKSKEDYLSLIATYFVSHDGAAFAGVVASRLTKLREALQKRRATARG